MCRLKLNNLLASPITCGIVCFVAAALFPIILTACPGCGEAMDATVGRGFNMSIAFMISMPFVIMGGLLLSIILVVRAQKNGKTQKSLQFREQKKRGEAN